MWIVTILITFSMLEIYLGNLRELVVPQPMRATDPLPPCLLIQTDPKGEIGIENLVSIQVSDFNQALKLYRLGCQLRSTASTNSNTTSSRFHWCSMTMIQPDLMNHRFNLQSPAFFYRKSKLTQVLKDSLGN
ncbi:hypothetical protein CRYUN_Cryun11dG0063500 [Craigia yunnanensis]